MSLVVNNNMMAANTARNLNAHYGRLATSTQRLSSGLRVNSAADDAAGLAIRELQRADIAALHQGARNANDAISMIQVADGSLGIIDEKLIRMKELAEQAATGTYDSTQRLMIESEYQAMASEITRIANATDFNGTKLLDGTLAGDHDGSGLVSEGKMKIHFGTGNDSAEDYYYVEIGECTAQAFGLGNASTWQDVQRRGVDAFRESLEKQIKNSDLTSAEKGELLSRIDSNVDALNAALTKATDYQEAFRLWATDGTTGFLEDGKNWVGNSDLMERYLAAAAGGTITGVLSDVHDIAKDIETAISDVIPEQSKVITAPTESDYANVWKQVEAAAKRTAQSAGFNEEELQSFLYDKKSGLQTKWDEAVQDALAGAEADYESVRTVLIGKGVGVAGRADDGTLIDNDRTGAVYEYLQATSTEVEGNDDTNCASAINGDVIAYRNKAYQAYVKDPKIKAGPTTAQGVIDALVAANEKVFASAAEKAFADGATAADQAAALQQALKAMEEAAYNAGLNKNEVEGVIRDTAVKFVMEDTEKALGPGKGWNLSDEDLNLVSQARLDNQAWTGLKDRLGEALKALGAWAPENAFDNANTAEAKEEDYIADRLGIDSTTVGTFAENIAIRNQGTAAAKAENKLDEFWNSLRETEKQKLQYAWGQAAIYNLANAEWGRQPTGYGIDATDLTIDAGLKYDSSLLAQGMLNQALDDMQAKVGHMDFAGHTIETQEDAQHALDAINEAIVSKDKIRAHLGAAQNRLENTVSNLNIQAENLQAAESRISDVDVATEMTQFVRNQILTQSAVAMLSQANSLPQMAMQLIGG